MFCSYALFLHTCCICVALMFPMPLGFFFSLVCQTLIFQPEAKLRCLRKSLVAPIRLGSQQDVRFLDMFGSMFLLWSNVHSICMCLSSILSSQRRRANMAIRPFEIYCTYMFLLSSLSICFGFYLSLEIGFDLLASPVQFFICLEACVAGIIWCKQLLNNI